MPFAKTLDETLALAAQLQPMVADVAALLQEARARGESLLFEGAQGALLDIDHGTYPYVTSSNCLAGAAAPGAGVGPQFLDYVLGIVKAYTTRVGTGPFPTELTDDIGARLAKRGNEFGSVTGRPRRCGWLDIPALTRSLQLNGVDGLCITKLDVLDGMREIRICTGYTVRGRPVALLPSGADAVAECVPVYEALPGWSESTVGVEDVRRAAARTRAPTSSGSRRSPACRSRWSRPGRTATRRSCCTIRFNEHDATDARGRSHGEPARQLGPVQHAGRAARAQVHESGYEFDQIICIARGGMRVGDVLSRIYEQPLAILSTHSYAAEGGTIRGELVIAEHMTMTSPRLGDARAAGRRHGRLGPHARGRGRGAAAALPVHQGAARPRCCGGRPARCSSPTIYVEYLPDNPWIHQPFEVYDTLRPEDLKARLGGARRRHARCHGGNARASRAVPAAGTKNARERGRLQAITAILAVSSWCPGRDSNPHSVATART